MHPRGPFSINETNLRAVHPYNKIRTPWGTRHLIISDHFAKKFNVKAFLKELSI